MNKDQSTFCWPTQCLGKCFGATQEPCIDLRHGFGWVYWHKVCTSELERWLGLLLTLQKAT